MIELVRRYVLDSFKTVEDLSNVRVKRFKPPLQHDRRRSIKIAVVDDQPFAAGVNLRNLGYDIVEIGDLKKVSEIEDYPIVLCDLMDVGAHFDRVAQGASIIREIRRNYPAVLVAAYTGSALTAEPVQRARQYADDLIKKDAEIETWSDQLDKLISSATDIRLVWLRTRQALIDEQVDTRTLLRLEDAYVRSLKLQDTDFKAVREAALSPTIGNAASNIVTNVISSVIFRLVMGG